MPVSESAIISVCIPVFNGERFIGETIRSILNQTYPYFELIVSDNASTDGTARVVLSFADPRIRYIQHNENVGPIENFQRCLEEARGRYIKLVCADDLLYPECLARQVEVLERDTGHKIALVSANRDVVDENSRVILKPRIPHFSGLIPAEEAIRRSLRAGTNIFCEPHAVLARTDDVRAVGGYKTGHGFCMDMVMAFRLLRRGDLYRLNEALSAFRLRTDSWSVSIAHRQYKEFAEFAWDFHHNGWLSISERDIRHGIRRAILLNQARRLLYTGFRIRRRIKSILAH